MAIQAFTVSGAIFYVRSDGNNGNAGTADNAGGAWLTVTFAESQMAAGDSVYIRTGTYEEAPTVNLTGNSGAWINFVGESGTILRGLYVSGASYIRIINIEFTQTDSTFNHNGSDNSAIVQIGTCTQIQWIDNYIHDTWGGDGGCAIYSSGTPTFITMRGNRIYWVNKGSGHANMTAINAPFVTPHHWLIEYNTIQRSLDYISAYGTNQVIRNNTLTDHDDSYWPTTPGTFHSDFFQPGSDGAATGTRFHLYEANLCGDNVCMGGTENSANGHMHLLQDTVSAGDTNMLIRGNVGYNINNGVLGVIGMDKISFFNNSYYDLLCPGTSDRPFVFYNTASVGSTIRNTIIQNIGSATAAISVEVGTVPRSNNLGYQAGSDASYVSTSNPNYVSPTSPTRNFRLQAGSPAINVGTNLVWITSADSSGTSFDVNDGQLLFDGWGLVEGDIVSTWGATRRITSIANNTVTLDASVTWTNLQPLFWGTDTTPDLGALPYGSTALTAATISNSGTTYTVTPSGDTRGVWFYTNGIPSHWDYTAPYSATLDYTVTAKAYALYAQATPVVAAVSVGPRIWNVGTVNAGTVNAGN